MCYNIGVIVNITCQRVLTKCIGVVFSYIYTDVKIRLNIIQSLMHVCTYLYFLFFIFDIFLKLLSFRITDITKTSFLQFNPSPNSTQSNTNWHHPKQFLQRLGWVGGLVIFQPWGGLSQVEIFIAWVQLGLTLNPTPPIRLAPLYKNACT